MRLADRYNNQPITGRKLPLSKKIFLKGRDEQELQHLFPSLYGSHAVTKNTRSMYAAFDKRFNVK